MRREQPRPVTAQDLPEMLLAHANVTPEQLQRALEIQHKTGDFIGEILVAEGVLDENSLVAFLARHCKVPHLSLLDYLMDESLLELVPAEFCLKNRLVPIDKMGRNLTVAMVNPLDTATLGELHERWPDLRIKPILCTAKHFEAVAGRFLVDSARRRTQQKMAYTEEAEMLAAAPVGMMPKPDVGVSIDAVDMGATTEKMLPSDAPMASEDELPPAAGFGDTDQQLTPSPVPEDPTEALLDSIFGLNSEGIREESGDGLTPDGTVIPGKFTRKMTTVMVQSMRNTYGVLARRITLFRGIDPESVAKLFARGKTMEFEAGQTIFRKGELGRCMYVVLSGTVEIFDEERTVAHLEQGENFGEMALLSNAARSASARATSPTSLLVLSFADITHDLDKRTSIQLLLNITVVLSSRLRRAQSL